MTIELPIKLLTVFGVLAVLHPVAWAQASPPAPAGTSGDLRQACIAKFTSHRAEFSLHANAFVTAQKAEPKPSVRETCRRIGRIAQATERWRQFIDTNGSACGIPATAYEQLQSHQTRIAKAQKDICQASERRRFYLPDREDLFPLPLDQRNTPQMRISS